MVTTIEISEEFDVPAVENPAGIEFQAKRMINTDSDRHIVSGLKDAYRTFKVDKNGKLHERDWVHDSITDAMNKNSTDKQEWIESTMSFEALLISATTNYTHYHLIRGENGVVDSMDLIRKEHSNPGKSLSDYHDIILDYLNL